MSDLWHWIVIGFAAGIGWALADGLLAVLKSGVRKS